MKKSLFNKQHNDLLSTSSSNALTHVNNDRNHQLIANVTLPIVSKQTIDYNAEIKDSFVSHIPMMSSSSSSSSLSNPKPLLDQQVPVKSEPLVIT
ncbi:unnamed protein product, partial [Rotaria sp. Silwood2]